MPQPQSLSESAQWQLRTRETPNVLQGACLTSNQSLSRQRETVSISYNHKTPYCSHIQVTNARQYRAGL
jgi:hypothetical protein